MNSESRIPSPKTASSSRGLGDSTTTTTTTTTTPSPPKNNTKTSSPAAGTANHNSQIPRLSKTNNSSKRKNSNNGVGSCTSPSTSTVTKTNFRVDTTTSTKMASSSSSPSPTKSPVRPPGSQIPLYNIHSSSNWNNNPTKSPTPIAASPIPVQYHSSNQEDDKNNMMTTLSSSSDSHGNNFSKSNPPNEEENNSNNNNNNHQNENRSETANASQSVDMNPRISSSTTTAAALDEAPLNTSPSPTHPPQEQPDPEQQPNNTQTLDNTKESIPTDSPTNAKTDDQEEQEDSVITEKKADVSMPISLEDTPNEGEQAHAGPGDDAQTASESKGEPAIGNDTATNKQDNDKETKGMTNTRENMETDHPTPSSPLQVLSTEPKRTENIQDDNDDNTDGGIRIPNVTTSTAAQKESDRNTLTDENSREAKTPPTVNTITPEKNDHPVENSRVVSEKNDTTTPTKSMHHNNGGDHPTKNSHKTPSPPPTSSSTSSSPQPQSLIPTLGRDSQVPRPQYDPTQSHLPVSPRLLAKLQTNSTSPNSSSSSPQEAKNEQQKQVSAQQKTSSSTKHLLQSLEQLEQKAAIIDVETNTASHPHSPTTMAAASMTKTTSSSNDAALSKLDLNHEAFAEKEDEREETPKQTSGTNSTTATTNQGNLSSSFANPKGNGTGHPLTKNHKMTSPTSSSSASREIPKKYLEKEIASANGVGKHSNENDDDDDDHHHHYIKFDPSTLQSPQPGMLYPNDNTTINTEAVVDLSPAPPVPKEVGPSSSAASSPPVVVPREPQADQNKNCCVIL